MQSHQLLLSVLVVSMIVTVLVTSKPNITGYVPTTTYTQQLDLTVPESQRFKLTASEGSLKLASFLLSGHVTGNGLANVYLTDGNIKLLVYSNKKKTRSSLAHITGLAVSDLIIEPGEKLDSHDSLSSGYETHDGEFTNMCVDSCLLQEDLFNKKELYLDFLLEPLTTVHVSGITFASARE